jgi:hypothetical protein
MPHEVFTIVPAVLATAMASRQTAVLAAVPRASKGIRRRKPHRVKLPDSFDEIMINATPAAAG